MRTNDSNQDSSSSYQIELPSNSTAFFQLVLFALAVLESHRQTALPSHSEAQQRPQRKKPIPQKTIIFSADAIIKVITAVIVTGFIVSLAALLCVGATLATCLAFIVLTIGIITVLVLLARR